MNVKNVKQQHREFLIDYRQATFFYEDFANPLNPRESQNVEMVTDEYDYAIRMQRIADMMTKIQQSTGDLFAVTKDEHSQPAVGAYGVGNAFLECLRIDVTAIRREYPKSEFHPFFELFDRHVTQCGVRSKGPNAEQDPPEQTVGALNQCVMRIRAEARSADFRKRLHALSHAMAQNHRRLMHKFNDCFDVCSKVMIVRLDLGYIKKYCPPRERKLLMTDHQARAHWRKLLAHLHRDPIGKWLLLYAARLELGMLKGFHFHVLLAFNGNLIQDDVGMASRIGEYWKHIVTNGGGVYYSCNAHKYRYRDSLAIGVIHHDAFVSGAGSPSRANLERMVRYLTKSDVFLRFSAHRRRAFFVGGSPKKSDKRRGRPRSRYLKSIPPFDELGDSRGA